MRKAGEKWCRYCVWYAEGLFPAPREVLRIIFSLLAVSQMWVCVCVAVHIYNTTTILAETTLPVAYPSEPLSTLPFHLFFKTKCSHVPSSYLPFSVQCILANQIFFFFFFFTASAALGCVYYFFLSRLAILAQWWPMRVWRFLHSARVLAFALRTDSEIV